MKAMMTLLFDANPNPETNPNLKPNPNPNPNPNFNPNSNFDGLKEYEDLDLWPETGGHYQNRYVWAYKLHPLPATQPGLHTDP